MSDLVFLIEAECWEFPDVLPAYTGVASATGNSKIPGSRFCFGGVCGVFFVDFGIDGLLPGEPTGFVAVGLRPPCVFFTDFGVFSLVRLLPLDLGEQIAVE